MTSRQLGLHWEWDSISLFKFCLVSVRSSVTLGTFSFALGFCSSARGGLGRRTKV